MNEVNGSHRMDEVNGSYRMDKVNGLHRMDEVNGLYRMDEVNGLHRMNEVNGLHRTDEVNGSQRMNELNGLHRMIEVNGSYRMDEVNGLHRMDEVNGSRIIELTATQSGSGVVLTALRSAVLPNEHILDAQSSISQESESSPRSTGATANLTGLVLTAGRVAGAGSARVGSERSSSEQQEFSDSILSPRASKSSRALTLQRVDSYYHHTQICGKHTFLAFR